MMRCTISMSKDPAKMKIAVILPRVFIFPIQTIKKPVIRYSNAQTW